MDTQNTYTGFLIFWYPPPPPPKKKKQKKKKKKKNKQTNKQNKGGRLSGSTVLSYYGFRRHSEILPIFFKQQLPWRSGGDNLISQ